MNDILKNITTADLIKELESRKKKAVGEAIEELNTALKKLEKTCTRAYDADNSEYYIEKFYVEDGEVYFQAISE